MTAKRTLDVVVAALALVMLAPVLLVVALAIWALMGRPVLFIQQRPGLHERPFALVKFRTMRQAAVDADGQPLPDVARLTRLGRLLRATSLDELPELWNVLKGDMSLVGPRPLLMQYLPFYTPEQRRRHGVKPGITGWAQINGRNALSWDEKFTLDLWYCDHNNMWIDIKILFLTIPTLFRRSGINHTPNDTMPYFAGSAASAPNQHRSDDDHVSMRPHT